MMKILNQAIKTLSIIVFGFALVACSDTDGPAEDLFGTAASGAATEGTVYVIDAEGVELSRPINTDGSFRFDVRKLTAPFMLKTVGNNGAELYSYTADVNESVNVTPLTNLAMYIAHDRVDPGNADPATLYNSWSSSFSGITDIDVNDAVAVVNANLRPQFMAFSFDPYTYDFIHSAFAANGTGFDGMLNTVTVDLTAGINVAVDQIAPFVFETGISIVDYDIGGTNVLTTGEYTVTLSVAVDGGAASTATYLTYYLPAPDLPMVGNTQMVEDMFVSFYSGIGTVTINSVTVTENVTETLVEINADITTQDAIYNYVATYTYTQNL